jgi:hypothetical protein
VVGDGPELLERRGRRGLALLLEPLDEVLRRLLISERTHSATSWQRPAAASESG